MRTNDDLYRQLTGLQWIYEFNSIVLLKIYFVLT